MLGCPRVDKHLIVLEQLFDHLLARRFAIHVQVIISQEQLKPLEFPLILHDLRQSLRLLRPLGHAVPQTPIHLRQLGQLLLSHCVAALLVTLGVLEVTHGPLVLLIVQR